MTDAKTGSPVNAPSVSARSSGTSWSFSRALDEEAKRARPTTGLARHLSGYRVEPGTEPTKGSFADQDAATADAPRLPEDDDLIARDAKAGEAAWADTRVALIERALEAEATRLAKDPATAGEVAEHLAPLIEKAFAGAAAEAPGEHARAIVGREREPLESEILAKRAVSSVVARQRADRDARRATIDSELAALKADPQRWGAVSGRRQRLIDDLPIDDSRKSAVKARIAEAQASAAAEGLLKQNPDWLLEDLDDPAFAAALGKSGRIRWRSEAEAAIARRAEWIAAARADAASLAASDMQATLKRAADSDEPLPSKEAVTAAFGSEQAANAALAEAKSGRQRRQADAAVALMTPDEEAAWIGAEAGKEARAIRESAVANKRAALDADPGAGLTKHSPTLNELARAAKDDPAQLPRLADHYAALQKRTGVDESKTRLLPDSIAADLTDTVLAGETAQTRLDALMKLLDAAGGGDPARATEIATLLEGFGLPAGTAARWSELANPRTRRGARLALLGGFAKQIADEGKILSGESEGPEIVGGGEQDALLLDGPEVSKSVAFENDRTKRHEVILRRVQEMIASGEVSDEVAQRFLSDPRLWAFDRALNENADPIELEGANDQERAESFLQAADGILLAAGKLAELEEEYGPLIKTATFTFRSIMGGPITAYTNALFDRGIDLAIEKLTDEYFDDAVGFVAAQFAKKLPVDEAESEKLAVAAIFAGIFTVGVGLGAADIARYTRHIGRLARRTLLQTFNRPSLDEVPFLKDRPLTRNLFERILAMKGDENYTTALRKFIERDEYLRHLSNVEKRYIVNFYTMGVLPKAAENFFAREYARLSKLESFTVIEQHRINFKPTRRYTIADLVLVDGEIDKEKLTHLLDEYLISVEAGKAAVIESKGPLVDLSDSQEILRGGMEEAGRGDSHFFFQLPLGEVPPDMIEMSSAQMLREYKKITPELAKLVLDRVRAEFDPEFPYWQLLAVTSGFLGFLDTLPAEEDE